MVLGAGVTGLAAGVATGCPVYEARPGPGGLCGSYYVRPNGRRLDGPPPDGEAYRFEVGGGHWIFGGDHETLTWLDGLVPSRAYERRASVAIGDERHRVGYPIQHHLAGLGPELADRALAEITERAIERQDGAAPTMREWLHDQFGPTLAEVFFDPFHERYTAGLWDRIVAQDPGKSPLSLDAVRAGAVGERPQGGYNQRFRYPVDGLDALVRAMAERCDVRYGCRAVSIDPVARVVGFEGGGQVRYERAISTLPLVDAVRLAGVEPASEPDPYTSVLVVNLGATPGPRLGDDHWVFVPDARSGFHRFGVYSNVDESFLPASSRSSAVHGPARRTSIYVERAFLPDDRPSPDEEAALARAMVDELQRWGVIETVEVVDTTWIDVAYTWSWPGSTWREDALAALADAGVEQVGRYGRWVFQGIADSIAEGLAGGGSREG